MWPYVYVISCIMVPYGGVLTSRVDHIVKDHYSVDALIEGEREEGREGGRERGRGREIGLVSLCLCMWLLGPKSYWNGMNCLIIAHMSIYGNYH